MDFEKGFGSERPAASGQLDQLDQLDQLGQGVKDRRLNRPALPNQHERAGSDGTHGRSGRKAKPPSGSASSSAGWSVLRKFRSRLNMIHYIWQTAVFRPVDQPGVRLGEREEKKLDGSLLGELACLKIGPGFPLGGRRCCAGGVLRINHHKLSR